MTRRPHPSTLRAALREDSYMFGRACSCLGLMLLLAALPIRAAGPRLLITAEDLPRIRHACGIGLPSAAPPPGTATSPVQPSAAGTTATSGSTTAQPDSSAVPFSKAPIASSVKRITLSMGDAKMDFLQFRYVNSQGVACIAEMPAAEAEAKKSPQDWLVTFDLYKKGEVPKTTKTKKNPVKPLSDFPFVSPPPTPGASNNSSPR